MVKIEVPFCKFSALIHDHSKLDIMNVTRRQRTYQDNNFAIKNGFMKQRLLPLLALLVLQVVAFGQADSCFTLYIRPTLLGAPYYDIFPITVTNQTQGTTFTMSDSLLHNCDLTGVGDFEAKGFSLSAVHPNPSEGRADVTLTTGRDGNVMLQLFDEVGRLKASSTVALEQGTHTVEVSLSGRGLHILRATSHGQSVYAKIVNLASSGGGEAVKVSGTAGVEQDFKATKTQQNVNIGDKLALRYTGHTLNLVTELDSVQSGIFVFNLRFNFSIWYRLLRDNDTLCWNQNSFKNKTVAIPLPFEKAFFYDYNANHLIWKYIYFQDSTFTVVTNPECPFGDIPQPMQEAIFHYGHIRFEDVTNLLVWPIEDGQYKYTLSPYIVDSSLVESTLDIYTTESNESDTLEKPCHRGEFQLNIYTMDNVFVMQRFLKPRTKVFPKAFIMQKGHMDPNDWFDTPPPTIYMYFLENNYVDLEK